MDKEERLHKQLSGWTANSLAIMWDIEKSQLAGDYGQVKHLITLLEHNIRQINSLAEQLANKT